MTTYHALLEEIAEASIAYRDAVSRPVVEFKRTKRLRKNLDRLLVSYRSHAIVSTIDDLPPEGHAA